MARVLWVALAGCLLSTAVAPPPALPAETTTYAAYLTVVERSCAEREAAVLGLSRWSPEALEEVERRLYERALAQAPGHSEAHLRLGRVEVLLGRTEQGLSTLRWVSEHATEPDLVYLANLFIGRELTESGQADAALTSYRAALDADPDGQAASVALSHALRVGGNSTAAAEVLERGLASRRRAPGHDSWWRYPEDRLGLVVELVTQLHNEVCR